MSTTQISNPGPQISKKGGKRGLFNRFVDVIEFMGNKLPDPTILFMMFCAIVVVGSWIGAKLGWSIINPGTGKEVVVFNLLSREGLHYMFRNAVNNVKAFGPLGVGLVVMTSIGVMEASGILRATFLNIGLKVNKRTLTVVIVFLGIMANFATDIGFIVMPPLAAMLFLAMGRHPLAGMGCSYAACSAGLAANLLVGVGDATTTSITVAAAQLLNPQFTMSPTVNWYLFAGAVFVLTPVAVFVTEKIIEPRLGPYDNSAASHKVDFSAYEVSEVEKKALGKTVIFIGFLFAVLALTTIPSWGIFRDAKGDVIFMTKPDQLGALASLLTLMMALPSIFYGKLVGTIKNGKDFGKACVKGLRTIAPFILICVVAAQFIAYFKVTNLGIIIAVNGAKFIQSLGIAPLPLLLIMMLFFALVNLLVASSSAKWTLLAPVFVPMFMLLDFNPAIVQAAYRIGDSMTNAVTPLLAYFVILLGLAQEYDENAGMGTLMGILVPYTIWYGIAWIIYFSLYYLSGLPFGPGVSTLFM